MTVVYGIGYDDGTYYVTTKAEAIRLAREERAAGNENVYVTAYRVTERLGRRELFCRLLNGGSWSESSEDVPL